MLTITVPSVLFDRTREHVLHVEATSFVRAVQEVDRHHPGFYSDIFSSEGTMRPSLRALVDGRTLQTALDYERSLPSGTNIELVRVVSGG